MEATFTWIIGLVHLSHPGAHTWRLIAVLVLLRLATLIGYSEHID